MTYLPEIVKWRCAPEFAAFPYDAVLEEFHRRGKHFVRPELLADLAEVRAELPGIACPAQERELLERFLAVTLDKVDGRYDYLTYLCLALLPLPAPDQPPAVARGRWDRVTVHAVADALRFEHDALEGRTQRLPDMRPTPAVSVKRFRLGLRVIRPALGRLGLLDALAGDDPREDVRRLTASVAAKYDPVEQVEMRLSMLPVWTGHDEYMFIRILQAFEATFGLLATQLSAVIRAVGDGRVEPARRLLGDAEATLHESAPLFSLLATMTVESFRTFRQWTEGASAIQSRNYKTVEALCRPPDPQRLDAAAFQQVPEIRQRVLDGHPNLADAVEEAVAAGRLDPAAQEALSGSMDRFAAALQQWRRTHYRIAVRMLGERTGTGYTEGTPYLGRARDIPVFRPAPNRPEQG